MLALVQMKGWQQSFQPVMTSQFCLLSSELEGNGMIGTVGCRLAHGVLGVVCPGTRRSNPHHSTVRTAVVVFSAAAALSVGGQSSGGAVWSCCSVGGLVGLECLAALLAPSPGQDADRKPNESANRLDEYSKGCDEGEPH